MKGSTMNKERLLRLAARMEKVKEEHFDISSWSSIGAFDPLGYQSFATSGIVKPLPDYVEYTEKGERKVLLREGFCGSTACVLGQAGLIKEFNKEGLYIDVTGDGKNTREGAATVTYFDPESGTTYFGDDAGMAFFDLTGRDARLLFYTGDEDRTTRFYYGDDPENPVHEEGDPITPQMVAKALRKFVETDGASADAYFD